MRKLIKWLSLAVGSLIVLIILALLIIPAFVDVQHFKPQLEKQVSRLTGRPLTLGGDLSLSLFPWAALSLSDVSLGNPPGFTEKNMVVVKTFEVQVRLFPLLFKDIQVKRFIVDTPRIVLERRRDGRSNWEGIGQSPDKPGAKKAKPGESEKTTGIPIKALAVEAFAIKNASLLWIDQVKGGRTEVSDFMFRLDEVSLDRAIGFAASGQVSGHPVSLNGKLGPIGRDPGKGAIPLVLSLKAFKELEIGFKGNIVDVVNDPRFDFAIETPQFSPRKVMASLGQTFVPKTTDPRALSAAAFEARLQGNPRTVSVSDGVIRLDDSKIGFFVQAKDLSKPDVRFDLSVDQIDLDSYLAPTGDDNEAARNREKTRPSRSEQKPTDYTPLRKVVLDGSVRVGEMKACGAKLKDLKLRVSGENGRFRLDPITAELYKGSLSSNLTLDVRQDVPKTHVALKAEAVHVNPLLKDLVNKTFLEGKLNAELNLDMAGDVSERIKETLNGQGDILFQDGSIRGVDLAGMVRHVKAAFGLAKEGDEKPRTDFSELHVPFTITNGVVNTSKTTLASPALRVLATGTANLARESLNFRVEPKFVATLKGQGDTMEHAALLIPVLVTGSFSAPEFRPDLEGIVRKGLEGGLSQPSELKKILPNQKKVEDVANALKEKAKGLLRETAPGQ